MALVAAEYSALKRRLAGRMADDREGYTAAKTTFITRVEASGQRRQAESDFSAQ
jgi:GrpB-like predicted nucleotidyltransferase (UPF0157 family)